MVRIDPHTREIDFATLSAKAEFALFPIDVRDHFIAEFERIARNIKPHNSKPMSSIGKSVFELKYKFNLINYRIIYHPNINGLIIILVCFEKKSQKTPRLYLENAKSRLQIAKTRV